MNRSDKSGSAIRHTNHPLRSLLAEPQPNAPAGTSAQGMHDAVDSGITADFGLTAGSGTTTAGSGIVGGSYGLPSEEVLDALTARAFAEGADF